jgi:hypothetical protein
MQALCSMIPALLLIPSKLGRLQKFVETAGERKREQRLPTSGNLKFT